MLSLEEACKEDEYPEVCEADEVDADLDGGWDVDLFLEEDLRPELRFFAGTRPDVKLLCSGGRKIAVHREVLAEREYFKALLDFEGQAAEFVRIDEDVEVLMELVRWIYCRDATSDKELAAHLFRLAGSCEGFDDLEDHCARALAAAGLSQSEVAARVAAAKAAKGADDPSGGGGEGAGKNCVAPVAGAADGFGKPDAEAVAEPLADCDPPATVAEPASNPPSDSPTTEEKTESQRKKKD